MVRGEQGHGDNEADASPRCEGSCQIVEVAEGAADGGGDRDGLGVLSLGSDSGLGVGLLGSELALEDVVVLVV